MTTDAQTAPADTEQERDPTTVELTFDDMYVLSADDVDAFAVDWNDRDDPPPYYVVVDGKRFAYTGDTYLVRGYGAELPDWVKEQEAEGRLTLFVERFDRLLAYLYDPAVEAEEDEEGSE